MSGSTDGGRVCNGVNIKSIIREGMNASNRAEGGTSAFSWVANPSSRLVVMATTRRYFFRHPAVTPFCEGVMRRTKRGWDPSFFWQFVNGTHGTADCLKRVVPLVTPAFSTRSSPCCWRHSLPPFFIACGRPNAEAVVPLMPWCFDSP